MCGNGSISLTCQVLNTASCREAKEASPGQDLFEAMLVQNEKLARGQVPCSPFQDLSRLAEILTAIGKVLTGTMKQIHLLWILTTLLCTCSANPLHISAMASGGTQVLYTGQPYEFIVPDGTSSLQFTLYGASGGDGASNTYIGGAGAVMQATVPVTAGQTLRIYVGGQGSQTGGYNGGGAVNGYANPYARGGGGATDVRVSPFGLADRILIAGGGGGGSGSCNIAGGAGGYPAGATPPACRTTNPGGGGGTATAGGTISTPTCVTSNYGTQGTGGAACTDGTYSYGGGGGGGLYGGSGSYSSGGGGGSSYASVTPDSYSSSGVVSGNGYAFINGLPITASPIASLTPNPTYQPIPSPTAPPLAPPTPPPSVSPSAPPTAVPTNPAQRVEFTGGSYDYTVGVGVYSLQFTLYGASGGGSSTNLYSGGSGAVIQAVLPVTPNQVLRVFVGGQGTQSTGGFNGGGAPTGAVNGYSQGGGGCHRRARVPVRPGQQDPRGWRGRRRLGELQLQRRCWWLSCRCHSAHMPHHLPRWCRRHSDSRRCCG